MPVINIGDIQIPVQMAQKTTPSLKIMDATGTIYYVDAMAAACPNAVKISDGENIYSIGNQTLVYQAENFNSCDTVSLEPGCYYAEIRGGRGGDGGNNADSGGDAQIQTYSFVISQQTDVVVDRIRRSLHFCDFIRRVHRIRRQTFSGDRVAVDRRRDVHGDGVRDQRNSAI